LAASSGVAALDLIVRSHEVVPDVLASHFGPQPSAVPDVSAHRSDRAHAEAPGRVDLGLPLLVDFGVVEAPYDDGAAPFDREALGSGGFSGSVLSLLWRRPLPRGLVLQGQACLVRDQDLGLLDGLGDARFAFAVLGISVSF
jgi:hypothetical protein